MKTLTIKSLRAAARVRALRLVLLVRDVMAFCCEFHLRLYHVSHRWKFSYWWYYTEEGKSYFGISWLGWNLENVGYLPSRTRPFYRHRQNGRRRRFLHQTSKLCHRRGENRLMKKETNLNNNQRHNNMTNTNNDKPANQPEGSALAPQTCSAGFLEDSKIIQTKGDWHLVIYAKRCLALVNKAGTEIKTLGCDFPEKDDGSVADESFLIDWVADEYFKQNAKADTSK